MDGLELMMLEHAKKQIILDANERNNGGSSNDKQWDKTKMDITTGNITVAAD